MAKEYVSGKHQQSLYVTFANDWKLFFIKPQGNSSFESFARRYFPYKIYTLKNKGVSQVDSLFRQALYSGLKEKDFYVYSDSSVSHFLSDPREKFIIEFLQMYIEESSMPVCDTLYFDSQEFISFDTMISKIDISFWLRINPVDDTLTAAPVLFATFHLIDFFQGSWEYNFATDQYKYNYSFTALNMTNVLSLFISSGESLAAYTYDYFLNLYLFNRTHEKSAAYYSWNGRSLKKAGIERFIFIKPDLQ